MEIRHGEQVFLEGSSRKVFQGLPQGITHQMRAAHSTIAMGSGLHCKLCFIVDSGGRTGGYCHSTYQRFNDLGAGVEVEGRLEDQQ